MMFVALLPEEAPDKAEWSSKDIEVLTKKWRAVRTHWREERRMCGNVWNFLYRLYYLIFNRLI